MDSADGDNVYEVTVTVSDGSGTQIPGLCSSRWTNKEEAWKITLTQRSAAGRDSDNGPAQLTLTSNITDTKVAVVQGNWELGRGCQWERCSYNTRRRHSAYARC